MLIVRVGANSFVAESALLISDIGLPLVCTQRTLKSVLFDIVVVPVNMSNADILNSLRHVQVSAQHERIILPVPIDRGSW